MCGMLAHAPSISAAQKRLGLNECSLIRCEFSSIVFGVAVDTALCGATTYNDERLPPTQCTWSLGGGFRLLEWLDVAPTKWLIFVCSQVTKILTYQLFFLLFHSRGTCECVPIHTSCWTNRRECGQLPSRVTLECLGQKTPEACQNTG